MTEIKKAVLGSVRLDSDVWEAVRAMDCSLNQYLRAALLGVGLETDPLRAKSFIQPPGGHTDPSTIPGVSVGVPTKEVKLEDGFPCRCVHANCGQKFTSPTRMAKTCDACSNAGHKGDPRNCEECLLLQGGL